jgi:hypothetical protein
MKLAVAGKNEDLLLLPPAYMGGVGGWANARV